MAAILQLRRGTSNVTLTEGELYLHQGSGSVQFGSGSSQHTLVKIGSNTGNVSLIGDLSVTGNLTVSQNITFGGSLITLGNEDTDNIVISGELSSSLIPNDDAAFDLGSSSKRYKNLYVVSASIDNISLPGSNIVSSSQQISTYGVFLEIGGDNVFSASSQVNADSITNFDSNVLDKINFEGVFSGSSQVTYSGISSIPSGIVSGSSQITPLLPTGTVSGSSQVSYPNLSNIPSGIVSGSSQVSYPSLSNIPSGIVSGSSQVNADSITNFDTNVKDKLNADGVISGSSQVNADSITNFDSNVKDKLNSDSVISGSSQIDITSTTGILDISSRTNLAVSDTPSIDMILTGDTLSANAIGGIVSGSSQVSYPDLSNIPSGIISGSSQLTLILPSGVVSGSSQVSYPDLSNIPSGIVSGSSQVNADSITNFDTNVKDKLNSDGVISGSSQVNADSITNFDSNVKDKLNSDGVISGSSQVILGSIPGFNSYTNSVDSRVDSIESYTSSLKTAIDVDGSDLIVLGNLTVQGTQTSLNTTQVLIEDLLLTLASGSVDGNEANGAGIEIAGANQSITWDNPNTRWSITSEISASGFIGDGSQLENVTAAEVEFSNVLNKPTLISGSSQVTESLDSRYLQIEGDSVVSGSVQIDLTQTSNYVSGIKTRLDAENVHSSSYLGTATTTNLTEGTNLYYTDSRVKTKLNSENVFSSSVQVSASLTHNFSSSVVDVLDYYNIHSGSYLGTATTTNLTEGTNLYWTETRFSSSLDKRSVISGSSQVQINDVNGFNLFSSSVDTRLDTIEGSFSQSVDSRLDTIEGSFSQSVDSRLDLLESFSSSQYNSDSQSFDSRLDFIEGYSSSIDSRLDSLEGDQHNHSNKANIDVINQDLSSTDSPTFAGLSLTALTTLPIDSSELNAIFLSSSNELIYRELGTAALYHVTSSDGIALVSGSISYGSDNLLTAGAVKKYVDWRTDEILDAIGAADITAVIAGDGLGGGGTAGDVTVTLDTASAHFNDGVLANLISLNSFTSSLNDSYVTEAELATATGSLINLIATKLDTGSFNIFSQSVESRLDTLEGETHENPLTFSDTTKIDFTRVGDTITATVIGGVVSGSGQLTDMTGDVTVNSSGVSSITANSIVNADINTSAGIVYTKLNFGGSGILSSSEEIWDFDLFSASMDSRITYTEERAHTHTNKSQLDTINQNLSNTSNVKFGIISASGDIVPTVALGGSLGSQDLPWADLWVGAFSLHVGNKTISEENVVTTSSLQSQLPQGIVSSSTQIEEVIGQSAIPFVSSSQQISNYGVFAELGGDNLVSSSQQISNYGVFAELGGDNLVSSSEQISGYNVFLEINGDNVVSSSQQISNYGVFAELGGDNLVSSSAQVKSLLPSGTVSGSSQVSYPNLSNIPAGIVSGAVQVKDLGFVDLNSDQTISGTKTFTDIVVNGTGSFAYFVASQTSLQYIGDSFIVLNNDTPTERYAGIAVYDSGSADTTASLQFDGQTNDWFYEYSTDGGVTTDHGTVLFGPEYSTKGSPTYLTTNKIPKSNGSHHLNDSNITDTGTLITLGSNSVVNGTFYATGTTLVSGSSQVLGNTGIVSSSAQIDALGFLQVGGDGVISGSSQVTLSGDITGTANNTAIGTGVIVNADVNADAAIAYTKLNLQGSGIVSGAAQIDTLGFLKVGGDGVISGSSQVNADTITNFDANVLAYNNTLGVVSSSAQIDTLGFLKVNGDGVISGSSQVNADTITNFDANVLAYNNSLGIVSGAAQIDTLGFLKVGGDGVISGSSQVTLSSAIGYGSLLRSDADDTASGIITFSNTTASTSKTTGAVIVTGGVGIGGALNVGGDVVAYASSDERLKDEITPIENPLQKINSIGGYSFVWNEEKQHIYKGKDYGVIAQEIEEILPELVDTRENGYKAVKYDKLISLLIEGIKELSSEVQELKNKLNQ